MLPYPLRCSPISQSPWQLRRRTAALPLWRDSLGGKRRGLLARERGRRRQPFDRHGRRYDCASWWRYLGRQTKRLAGRTRLRRYGMNGKCCHLLTREGRRSRHALWARQGGGFGRHRNDRVGSLRNRARRCRGRGEDVDWRHLVAGQRCGRREAYRRDYRGCRGLWGREDGGSGRSHNRCGRRRRRWRLRANWRNGRR